MPLSGDQQGQDGRTEPEFDQLSAMVTALLNSINLSG